LFFYYLKFNHDPKYGGRKNSENSLRYGEKSAKAINQFFCFFLDWLRVVRFSVGTSSTFLARPRFLVGLASAAASGIAIPSDSAVFLGDPLGDALGEGLGDALGDSATTALAGEAGTFSGDFGGD
jgi:hypothetical protein